MRSRSCWARAPCRRSCARGLQRPRSKHSSTSATTRAYVNGRLASAAQLAELARGLCDISSQHEHHTLVDAGSHVNFLDAFAELEPLRGQMVEAFRAFQEAHEALASH